MTTASEIKNLYNEYKTAAAAEKAAFERDESTEAEIDAAIERTVNAELAFQKALVSFAGGAITEQDVRRMMAFKADKLDSLIARIAA